MKNIKKLLSLLLVLALCLTSAALADEDVPSIDDILSRRIDMTEYSSENGTEEDELDKAIREIMDSRIDLTDQPANIYSQMATPLENFVRMMLGTAVPIGNTINTIHECQCGYYTSDQKIVKLSVALTIDIVKSALPMGTTGQINSRAQSYINELIRTGKFQGGSNNRNVEYTLAAVESVFGGMTSDVAGLVSQICSGVSTLLNI